MIRAVAKETCCRSHSPAGGESDGPGSGTQRQPRVRVARPVCGGEASRGSVGKSICRAGAGLVMAAGLRHSLGSPGRSRVEPGHQHVPQPPDPQLPWPWLSRRWGHPRGSPRGDRTSRAGCKWVCGGHGQRGWVEAPRDCGRGRRGALAALGALTPGFSCCECRRASAEGRGEVCSER